ncbi:MAG: hypothetical protein R3225_09645 [Halofilum sp. (in: g-proteobacteria)]|nr:hypothetical protein [Halofilum sp. (in: g-proteobacteria)]
MVEASKLGIDMGSLRERMADRGFESNIDYGYHLRCLLSQPDDRIPALNVEGDSGRRKTAFATALAAALEYPRQVYHDFTQAKDPPPKVIPPPSRDEEGREEPPIPAFERVMSDACAFSEGEKTVLILDQLQAADFRDHIRLYEFLTEHEWHFRDATFTANARNLVVLLISEEPLYHSLQKASFSAWVPRASVGEADYVPADFGLGPEAAELMAALGALFRQLGVQPTPSEFQKLLHDIQHNVRTADELSHSIYGWTEGIDRTLLLSDRIQRQVRELMPLIEDYVGVEHVELTAAHGSVGD